MQGMAAEIPADQFQFAQIAATQRFTSSDNVKAAVDLYQRYLSAGGEQPSMARILVGKGWISRSQGATILRHLIEHEPLPAVNNPGAPVVFEELSPIAEVHEGSVGSSALGLPPIQSSEFDIDELGLEPPGSNVDLPVSSGAEQPPVVDERQALIQGLGATVLRKELKDIKGYKITQVIGEGSMGTVYKAHQISMDRTVALKVLPAEKTKDQRFVEEFLTQARNMGRLNQPNLIRVHEVGKSGDTYFYSMEYVEGQRLDEWMDECEGGRLEVKEAVKVFIQVAAALDYGFRAGVIHREIRPNTIMVGDDGQAKLADLGLTKDEQTRFLDGENAYYVAPEQAKGLPSDTRTDIYSLGCCLFHCLTGEPPFQGGAPRDVLSRRLVAVTPDPREINPDVPVDLSQIVMRMMARDPKERFQTPSEVAEALKKVSISQTTNKKTLPVGMGLGLKKGLRPGQRRAGAGGRRPLNARGRANNKNRYRR
jgi:predicted Ser/Thr protein kinase